MNNFINKIKVLREMTGVSLSDCKKALIKAEGSLEVSITELRKIGFLRAESVSKRSAKEGNIGVFISEDKKRGVLIELNSETDFVSRKDEFKDFLVKISKIAVENALTSKEELIKFNFDDNKTVNDFILNLISVYNENIFIGNYNYINVSDGFLSSYVHGSNVGKIGTIVHYLGDEHSLAHDIALHITAMNPSYLDYNLIPDDVISHEKNIFYSEVKNIYPDKKEDILAKIVDGKLNKYFSKIVLLKQEFVKSPDLKVEAAIKGKISILNYFRSEVGK